MALALLISTTFLKAQMVLRVDDTLQMPSIYLEEITIRTPKEAMSLRELTVSASVISAALVDRLPPERLHWNAQDAKVQTDDHTSFRITYQRNGESQTIDSNFVMTATASTALPEILPMMDQSIMENILKRPMPALIRSLWPLINGMASR